jgi:hypothetical protein
MGLLPDVRQPLMQPVTLFWVLKQLEEQLLSIIPGS